MKTTKSKKRTKKSEPSTRKIDSLKFMTTVRKSGHSAYVAQISKVAA
jgi:hypothetical protein